MDGSSYTNHNVWNQNTARSPLSPNIPTSGTAYRANVNRQKTKKWVEAKPQNYDGDDWGDDYDEPDEPDEPYPPPPSKTGRQQPGHGVQSPAQPHSLPAAVSPTPAGPTPRAVSLADPAPVAESAMPATLRPSGSPPALHVHTQEPFGSVSAPEPAPAPSVPTQPPLGNGDGPASPQSSGTVAPSGPSSIYSLSEAGYTPASLTHPSPVATQSGPIPNRYPHRQTSVDRGDKPADIYRRIGEQFEQDRLADSPQPSADSPNPDIKRLEHISPPEATNSSTIKLASPAGPTVPREFSVVSQASLVVPTRSMTPPSVQQHAEGSEDARRYSTSPQLPNLARMSAFGVDDIFSGYERTPADAPTVPTIPENIISPLSPNSPLKSVAPRPATAPRSLPSAQLEPSASAGSATTTTPTEKIMSEHLGSAACTPAQLVSHSTETSGSETRSNDVTPPTREDGHASTRDIVREPSQERSRSPPAKALLVIETSPMPAQSTLSSKKPPEVDSREVSPVSDSESENEKEPALRSLPPATQSAEHATPHSLPPLRTASPTALLQEAKPPMLPASPPTSAGTAEITPIAPLNPHRAEDSPGGFIPPIIPQGEGTMSTVTSPSPIKESDRLREEIINSLSPIGPGPGQPDFPGKTGDVQQPAPDGAPASGATGDISPQGSSAPVTPGPRGQSAHFPVPESRDIRRDSRPHMDAPHKRFSWEEGPEQVTVGLESDTDAESGVLPPAEQQGLVKPTPVIQEPTLTPGQPEVIQMAIPPSNGGTMSHQVSQVSNMPRDGLMPDTLDPPSPVSVVTDKGTEEAPQLSLSGKDVPAVNAASGQVAVAPMIMPPHSTVKLMTFREILAIPSPVERTKKYDETRAQFMAMETGLSHFLSVFMASNSELANTTSIFPAPPPRMVPGGAQQMTPTQASAGVAAASGGGAHVPPHLHSQPSAQQPYYQQYLQASSPTVQSPAAGRPPSLMSMPMPGQPMQSQHPQSDFRHSGNQIGHKSKEFLSTAGKVGKGLLHKGRNKLRGTGDKTEEQSSSPSYGPPPSSHNKKTDRRTSWGLSLGGRTSRGGDGPSPQHFRENTNGPPLIQPASSVPSPAPRLPEPSRVSPFSSISKGSHSPAGPTATATIAAHLTASGPASKADQHSVNHHHDDAGVSPDNQQFVRPAAAGTTSQTELVSPVSESHSTPGPSDAVHVPPPTDLAHKQPVTWNPSQGHPSTGATISDRPQGAPHSRGPSASSVVADDRSDDWVVVSPQPDADQPRMAPQGAESEGLTAETAEGLQHGSQLPVRHPSFVGLPPIRRTSTFGISIGKKKGRAIDDESSPTVPEVPPLPSQAGGETVSEVPGPHLDGPQDPEVSDAHRINSFPSTVTEHGSMGTSTIPRSSEANMPPLATIIQHGPNMPPPQATPYQTNIMGKDIPFSPSKAAPVQAQQQPPLNQGQFMPPVARLQPGMIPLQTDSNSVQIPRPPPGWRVEESHLSEPLLPTSRQRAASNASDHDEPEDYGFDKETEAGLLRPKPRESRPSLGQQQRQGSTSQTPPSPRPQPANSPTTRDNHQRGFSISGDIGAGPCDPTTAVSVQDRHSDASSNLNAEENRGRRHSGLPSFGRGVLASPASSGDNALPRSRESVIAHSPSTLDQRTHGTPSPQFPPPEKKRTLFGKNAFSAGTQPKAPKPGLSRSSTSNSITAEGPAPKKRFSGLAHMFQKPASGQEHVQIPSGSSQTGRASLQSQPSGYAPPPPSLTPSRPFGRDRSNTTDSGPPVSFDGNLPQPAGLRPAGPEDVRGRRAVSSGGGFLSGLFNRSSSKPRESKPQQGQGPPPTQMYTPAGALGTHSQDPRMTMSQSQSTAIHQGPGPMYAGPQEHTGPPEQLMMGRGAPAGQFHMLSAQQRPVGPGQQSPIHYGLLPSQQGPQGVAQKPARQIPSSGAIQGHSGQPGSQVVRPFSAAEGRPAPPATSPSPLSQRSQALAQPPPADDMIASSRKDLASVSVTTPSSPRPDDGDGGLDKRTSSPVSKRSVEPPVGKSPLAGPSNERLSQQSSQSSPVTPAPWPLSNKSPQPESSSRFSAQGEPYQRSSMQSNNTRRVSTPSLVQSSPVMNQQQAQQTPGVQQQRLSGQASAGLAVASQVGPIGQGTGDKRLSPSHLAGPAGESGVPIQSRMMSPNQGQGLVVPSRTNTQATQMSGPPGGTPRPPFLSQQQSFASTQSTASSLESHGIPKLFGFKSKLPGQSGSSGEKHEKKPYFLSAFKKTYRQPETSPQQLVAMNQQQQVASSPQQQQQLHPDKGQGVGPQKMQQMPYRPMPGPHQQYQDQRPVVIPPVPAQVNLPTGPSNSAQPPMRIISSGHNSIQQMPLPQPGQQTQLLRHPQPMPPGPGHPGTAQQQQRRPSTNPTDEPKYESVPIPQAYRPVHGDGIPIASPYAMMPGYFLQPHGWAPPGIIPGPMASSQMVHGAMVPGPMVPPQMTVSPAAQGQAQVAGIPDVTNGAPPSVKTTSNQEFRQPSRSSVDTSRGPADRPTPSTNHSSSHLRPALSSQVQRYPSDGSQSSSVAPLPGPQSSTSNPSGVDEIRVPAARDGVAISIVQRSQSPPAASAVSQSRDSPALQTQQNKNFDVDTTTANISAQRDVDEPTPKESNTKMSSSTAIASSQPTPTASATLTPAQPAEIVMVVKPVVEKAKSPKSEPQPESQPRPQSPPPLQAKDVKADPKIEKAVPATTTSPTAGPSNGAAVVASAETFKTHDRCAEEKQVAFNLKDQEEKILVETDQNGRQGDDDDLPMMSATSYPGQEWNPYGNFEDWD